jgi:Ankyrin repeats (3 copies)
MKKGEEGLNKVYDDTVNRIRNQEQGIRELANKVLFWIVYAKRPLTTEELRHALAVEPGTCELDKTNLCPVKDMVSSCAGLVSVDGNIVRLVHYTTQEYFQRWGLKIFEDIQRDIIAISCLTYLSYDVFADGYLTSGRDLEFRLQKNPFFKYAAHNWAYHVQDTQTSVRDLALKFLMDDRKSSASSQVLLPVPPERFCGMHLVAFFGLNDIMVRLLREKDPYTEDSFGWTPLFYAVEKENVRVVKLLLDYNVDLNSKCNQGWTPLSRAIEGESEAVVGIFRAKGVKIDSRHKPVRISNHIRNYSEYLY